MHYIRVFWFVFVAVLVADIGGNVSWWMRGGWEPQVGLAQQAKKRGNRAPLSTA